MSFYTLPNTRSDGSIVGFSQFYDGTHSSFAPLSKRVIYQNFSFCIPNIKSEDDPAVYDIIKDFIPTLSEIGVTDIWWPPPYKALSLNVYQEGYAVMDRYDVGEFAQGNFTRTKYGTRAQLENVLSYSHEWGLRNICDIVPNQMYMDTLAVGPGAWGADAAGNNPQVWYSYIGTGAGQTATNSPITPLFVEYTEGGGEGQQNYGSFPYWYYYYFNGIGVTNNTAGTGTGTGPYIVMRDSSYQPYRFYGNGNSSNYLPDWLQEAYNANNSITIQSTGTYLLISQGWVDFVHFVPYVCYYEDKLDYSSGPYALLSRDGSTVESTSQFLRTYAYNQEETFLSYLRTQNISGSFTSTTTDQQILTWVKQYVGSAVGEAMGTWISLQPGYGGNEYSGMPGGWITFNMNTDNQTFTTDISFSQFTSDSTMGGSEYLLGTDVNNCNYDVQKDTVNWQEFLLDLGYDGFRFDAAQWYSQQILLNSAMLMSNKYGDDMVNHLSVLEAYESLSPAGDGGQGYESSINWGQLAYDTNNYYQFSNCLFAGFNGGTLLNIFQSFGGANSSTPPSDMDKTMLPAGPYAGGQFRGGNVALALNWSFVNNHDQEKSMMGSFRVDNGGASGSEDELKSWADQWTWDRRKSTKVHAPYNVVAAYAYILFNDFTVPTVYYGDLFDSQEAYMSVKSPYYAAIMLMLKVRNRYCSGQQFNEFYLANGGAGGTTVNSATNSGTQRDNVNIDSAAQIRFGTSRDTGLVHVMSLGSTLSYTVSVPFGKQHANQTVKNVFAVGEEYSQTDDEGNFDVFITPQSTVLFQGYFSLWIPL